MGTCAACWCWPGRYFDASTLHWLLCLHQSLITLCQSALAHSGPGSFCPQAWALVCWALGLPLMPTVPGSTCLGSGLHPASLLHIWLGLEAAKLSPVVVPGAALIASTPLLAKRSSLPPPWSYKFLSRAVPDFPFHLSTTSWHPPAPSGLGTRPLCLLIPCAIWRGPTRGRML